jgi:hypothetical protein
MNASEESKRQGEKKKGRRRRGSLKSEGAKGGIFEEFMRIPRSVSRMTPGCREFAVIGTFSSWNSAFSALAKRMLAVFEAP